MENWTPFIRTVLIVYGSMGIGFLLGINIVCRLQGLSMIVTVDRLIKGILSRFTKTGGN
jgi:hypothetical protein